MNTNYKILFFTLIINVFMALSLNNFVSSDVFLPALFLYFLSNLGAFLDKATFYNDNGYRCEKIISLLTFVVCLFCVCFYIAHTLNFIEMVFYLENATYKILIQGLPNSFFTFRSIDITAITFLCVALIPFSSFLLCIIPFLVSHGYTKTFLLKIYNENKKCCFVYLLASILFGLLGLLICYLKSKFYTNGIGTPQYLKYFVTFFLGTLALLCSTLVIRKNCS